MFPASVRREVLALLAAKAVALTVIYFVFFAPTEKSAPTAQAAAAHLLDGSAMQDGRDGHR